MFEDYDGADVVDVAGEKIGTVERSFDDADGHVRYVQVRTGTLLRHHYVLPAADTQYADGTLTVPYTKTLIEHSPDASGLGDTLDGDFLARVTSYFEGIAPAQGSTTTEAVTSDT